MQREEEEPQIGELQKREFYIVFQDRSPQASLKTTLITEYTLLTNAAPNDPSLLLFLPLYNSLLLWSVIPENRLLKTLVLSWTLFSFFHSDLSLGKPPAK